MLLLYTEYMTPKVSGFVIGHQRFEELYNLASHILILLQLHCEDAGLRSTLRINLRDVRLHQG